MLKKLFICSLFLLLLTDFSAQNTYHGLPVLKANSAVADYRIGEDWSRGNWNISPQIEFDSLLISFHVNNEEFVFYTDRDSISFQIEPDKVQKFYVHLNDTGYALTVVKFTVPSVLSFDTDSKNKDLNFFYETGKNNEYLARLREQFPIDSLISETTSDIEKAKRILTWVNRQWKHDGTNEPQKNDAISILEEARQGKSFRCVEYGIVATACLNAAGLKARTLGLMTSGVETTRYGAGHVLLEVYLNDLKKWALLDGQWDAIPFLKKMPLNAVEFQKAIVENYNELEIHSSSKLLKRQYVDWIFPYLYYFTISFDNREGTTFERNKINGKTSLMLVPLRSKNPTVFQIEHKIDYCLYTNSILDFYYPPSDF